MRLPILTLLLSVLCVSSCIESDVTRHTLSDEDLGAIGALRQALGDVIEAGDTIAYADLCSRDVRLLHAGSPIITGREEFISHTALVFEAIDVISLDLTPVNIYGTGDLAYEVGVQALSIEPSLVGFRSSRKYLHVMRRNHDGAWHFVALMSGDS